MIHALLEPESRKISVPGIFQAKQAVVAQCGGEMWQQNHCIITRIGTTVTLCGEPEDLSELEEFLQFLGGRIEGEASFLLEIFPQAHLRPVMEAPLMPSFPVLPEGISVVVPDRLFPVYELLCQCDPDFAASTQLEPWLVDFSYRCRHHFSKCFLLLDRGQITGVFCLLFRACGQALGGAFAVLPSFRKLGYGSLLLNYGAAFCTRQKEQLFLIAKNQQIAEYYQKRGWLQKGLAADWNFQEAL